MNTEEQFRSRLNSLLEGIQIIDYNWRYVYLNDVMAIQSKTSREELLGNTMMDKYPGIENTALFDVLSQCMEDRKSRRIENEFTFPDKSVKWFDLLIQPAEEGICILSLDITLHRQSEEKVEKGKSLYAFLSHINQSIVQLTNKELLFKSACKAAVDFGKFKMAWFGIFDDKQESISLVEDCGSPQGHTAFFTNAKLSENSSQRQVLETGSYYACNDIESEPNHEVLKRYAIELGINSFIIMPIRKSGKIIGTFNLYSEKPHFTGTEEILLLQEISGDISFALGLFEKERLHRETEQIVLQNEKRFRALIEKSADMKTLATAEGKLFYGSPSITKVLGYGLDKMLHASLFELIHPDDVSAFTRNRKKLIGNPGASIFFEARMKHKNGKWIWCEGTATNLLEESGVHAIVSNFRDISQKKSAEQQTEFDRNNTSALINNSNDLMWSIDSDLKLITSNNAFDETMIERYGSPIAKGENIIGSQLPKLVRKQYEKFYKKSLSGKYFRESIKTTEPETTWSEISFSPISKGDEIIGVACHSRDITERMKTKLELERQNKALVKTNFELDRFVYSVSHDLRSPLTSILGLVSFIEEESQEADTLAHAAMIKSGINRLDGFIKNILNYSRNNRTEVEPSNIALQEMAADIVATLRHSKHAEDVDFKIDICEEIPFCSDRQSLYTVLENIISNAIKFRKHDGSQSCIGITGFTDEESLRMSIADNGIGVMAEHSGKIFEMFFRSSSHIDGSGIGLYIVKEIINKLGGSIGVEPLTGGGTIFHIRLKNLRP